MLKKLDLKFSCLPRFILNAVHFEKMAQLSKTTARVKQALKSINKMGPKPTILDHTPSAKKNVFHKLRGPS